MMNAEKNTQENVTVDSESQSQATPSAENAGPQPAGEDIERLKAEAAKSKEYLDRLMRTAADFENYKKRATREKQDAVKFANESFLVQLIPLLDAFEMALAAVNNAQAETSVQSFQAGLNMIHQQFKKVLGEAGVEEVDATHQPFDPNVHEAVSQVETADFPEGTVAQQLRKGYKLRERLVRPASVIVAKAPANPA